MQQYKQLFKETENRYSGIITDLERALQELKREHEYNQGLNDDRTKSELSDIIEKVDVIIKELDDIGER